MDSPFRAWDVFMVRAPVGNSYPTSLPNSESRSAVSQSGQDRAAFPADRSSDSGPSAGPSVPFDPSEGVSEASAASAAGSAPPLVPDRWTRLSELLRDDLETALGLAGRIAETTAFGTVRPGAAVREVWELAVPAPLAAAVRRADLTVLAPLVRAGVFLYGPSSADGGPVSDGPSAPEALTVRAARYLAARQLPDGGFGEPSTTVDCAWALAETAAPGLTAAHPAHALPAPRAPSSPAAHPEHPARPRTVRSAPATYGGKE
jgi:hypothetical protein